MTRHEFDLLYTIRNKGKKSVRELAELTGTSIGFVSEKLREFTDRGYIDAAGITDAGYTALEPYHVKNAIIMAAGMSTRFVPLSLEKPKGLLVVKNEVLIERQIEQLRDAGIKEIVLVLGYKKESFFYLESKYDVKIIINPDFHIKNNIETIWLAQKYIGNSYICSSDDYFTENPFTDYVYQSYYSSIHVTEKTGEWYMDKDSKGNLTKVRYYGEEGDVMLGHAYWNNDFSRAFLRLVNEHHELGDYDDKLWEVLLADNVSKLPPMQVKVYPDGIIFEFDSLDELREYLRLNASRPLTVAEVAAHFGYSCDHLSRLYRREFGCDLKRGIVGARLRHIEALLLNTDYPLKTIAHMCGFGDENALVKFFGYHEGISPTSYRSRFFRVHRNAH